VSLMTGSNQYASASRVLGVCRYLLLEKNGRERRRVVEAMMSPLSMRDESQPAAANDRRPMIAGTIGESIRMGLLTEEDDTIGLQPELVKADAEATLRRLPLHLADLIFAADNAENHDLALSIAWFLGLPVLTPPVNWDAVQTTITSQGVNQMLELSNNARYSQFRDWVCFLGFAWRDPRGAIVPDPTPQLRGRLPSIFRDETTITLEEATKRIAEAIPVMEGGTFRDQVEKFVTTRPPGYLSESTATAWSRLADEGLVELIYEADAPHLVLPDGVEGRCVSRVRHRDDAPSRRKSSKRARAGESA
jgi:hypothetical protein